MPYYLGIDTSNYTTSAAVFDSSTGCVVHKKKLLPVAEGALGLKQSDAVFAHVKQLPQILEELFFAVPQAQNQLAAVGVSVRPRNAQDSYMPCFLTGRLAADAISATNGIPLYPFSHQCGHIAAALYSAQQLRLIGSEFVAFHFSGGTTECVQVSADDQWVFDTKLLYHSLDLKCGQAVDRVGGMLGLPFPAGMQLDRLAQQADKQFKVKLTFKDGNCCVSGVQNQCEQLLAKGESRENVARFCIDSVRRGQTDDRKCAGVLPEPAAAVFGRGDVQQHHPKGDFRAVRRLLCKAGVFLGQRRRHCYPCRSKGRCARWLIF
ncbi:MAG: peptidase M22 [Negativibacillus sp.]